MMPGANGGLLKIGNGGNRGGTGRPRDEIVAGCRELGHVGVGRLRAAVDAKLFAEEDLVNAHLALTVDSGIAADVAADMCKALTRVGRLTTDELTKISALGLTFGVGTTTRLEVSPELADKVAEVAARHMDPDQFAAFYADLQIAING